MYESAIKQSKVICWNRNGHVWLDLCTAICEISYMNDKRNGIFILSIKIIYTLHVIKVSVKCVKYVVTGGRPWTQISINLNILCNTRQQPANLVLYVYTIYRKNHREREKDSFSWNIFIVHFECINGVLMYLVLGIRYSVLVGGIMCIMIYVWNEQKSPHKLTRKTICILHTISSAQ